MDPCLEVDPTRLLIIVGPQFTETVLEEVASCSTAPTFDYGCAFEEGVRLLSNDGTDADRQKQSMLYRNAYELDPGFAVRKVTESLKRDGRYELWLSSLFARDLPTSEQSSESLEHLLGLQREGALLVYTHCDDTLSRVSNTKPILLDSPELAERWKSGRSAGFLHVHGVYTAPGSVKLDCSLYDQNSASSSHPAAGALKDAVAQRSTVVVGFDPHTSDPLHAKFLEGFLASSAKNCVFTIGQNVPYCLPVMSQRKLAVERSICAMANATSSLWKQMEIPTDDSSSTRILGLLVAGKQGATEISRKMFCAPGVNFALVNSVLHQGHEVHTVSIRIESTRFESLWQWLLESEGPSLLSYGLLAVVMENGMFVWLRGKPIGHGPTRPSNSEVMDASMSGGEPAEVAMETNPSKVTDSGGMRTSLHSTNDLAGKRAVTPPTPFVIPQDLSKTKRVPRWKVLFKNSKLSSSLNDSRVSSLLEYRLGAGMPPQSADDSTVLTTSNGIPIPRSVLSRRSSLPPIKRPLAGPREDANTLSQLASSLQNAATVEETPSYAAIKQALLCDTYKRRQSVVTDPKTLKTLLRTKLVKSERGELDLISQRRQSDPGSGVKGRDFERRKELFVDENTTWSRSYNSIIDHKISKWQQQRQARERFEMFRKHLKTGLTYQVVSSHAPPLTINPTHITSSASITTTTSPQVSALIQPTSYMHGVTPYVYPQAVYPSTTPPATAASAVYSSFVTPYPLVNPYSTLLANGQPTTYLIPQNTFLTPGGSPQKLVYFVPSTSVPPATATTGLTAGNPVTTSSVFPQLAKLIAPASTAAPTPTAVTTLPSTRRQYCSQDDNSTANLHVVSPNSRKRHSNPLPVKLASLLQSGGESPPPLKKHRSSEPMVCYTQFPNSSPSPRNHSSSSPTDCQLLRSQLQIHQPSNGFNEVPDRQELEEIIGGPPHAPGINHKDRAPSGRTQLQLWQFLLELLLLSANSHLIQWTDDDSFEFQINRPGDVAELWGKCTNNSAMNYEKLARGIRYYFSCGIMSKVSGKHLTFRYSGNVTSYIQMRQSQLGLGSEEVVVVE